MRLTQPATAANRAAHGVLLPPRPHNTRVHPCRAHALTSGTASATAAEPLNVPARDTTTAHPTTTTTPPTHSHNQPHPLDFEYTAYAILREEPSKQNRDKRWRKGGGAHTHKKRAAGERVQMFEAMKGNATIASLLYDDDEDDSSSNRSSTGEHAHASWLGARLACMPTHCIHISTQTCLAQQHTHTFLPPRTLAGSGTASSPAAEAASCPPLRHTEPPLAAAAPIHLGKLPPPSSASRPPQGSTQATLQASEQQLQSQSAPAIQQPSAEPTPSQQRQHRRQRHHIKNEASQQPQQHASNPQLSQHQQPQQQPQQQWKNDDDEQQELLQGLPPRDAYSQEAIDHCEAAGRCLGLFGAKLAKQPRLRGVLMQLHPPELASVRFKELQVCFCFVLRV